MREEQPRHVVESLLLALGQRSLPRLGKCWGAEAKIKGFSLRAMPGSLVSLACQFAPSAVPLAFWLTKSQKMKGAMSKPEEDNSYAW